jgi:hypothetical protein
MGDLTRIPLFIVFARQDTEAMAESTDLYEFIAYGHENTGSDKDHHQRRTPNKGLNGSNDLMNVHVNFLIKFLIYIDLFAMLEII